MKKKSIKGNNSIPGIEDNHSPEADISQKKRKKKQDKQKSQKLKKAKLQNSERKVFHYISEAEGSSKLSKKVYEKELARLQVELVKMQYWVKHTGTRIVILFEGRDAAGKGGTIKRITDPLNPRGCRVVALGMPSDRERQNGISSVMSLICPQPVKLSVSIAVGTIALESSM